MIRSSATNRFHASSAPVNPRRTTLRRAAAALLAGTTIATLAGPLTTSASAATRTVISIPPVATLSNLQLRSVVPSKKALLVLMENGGFTNGMPANATIGVPVCASFRAPAGANLIDFIASIAGSLGSALQCLNPGNWTTVQVPVTKYVAQITDRVIEDVGTSTINASGVANRYDRVVILQDSEFTVANVRARLTTLAPTHQVDIHVLAHGSPDAIAIPGPDLTAAEIRNLANIPGLFLRAVYQQNCFGSTLSDDWLAAGARVVNGSTVINYMPLSYFAFLSRWTAGQTFQQSVQGSTADWTPFFETVYRFVDLFNGTTARQPPTLGFGTLSPTEEISESQMIVQGPGTGITA